MDRVIARWRISNLVDDHEPRDGVELELLVHPATAPPRPNKARPAAGRQALGPDSRPESGPGPGPSRRAGAVPVCPPAPGADASLPRAFTSPAPVAGSLWQRATRCSILGVRVGRLGGLLGPSGAQVRAPREERFKTPSLSPKSRS